MQRTFYQLLSILMLLVGVNAVVYAQLKVSGKITDAKTGEGLYGATILEVGTTNGTTADFDGNYTLETKNNPSQLRISAVGYNDQTLEVNRAGAFDVKMAEFVQELDVVTVTSGRRKERALDAPASISVIEQKYIKNQVVATPTDYLTNASGVDIVKTGLVGANIVVRGFNNIFSGSLLSLVDNRITAVPSLRVNTQYMITANPNDIQRIEVLKGPASAMYGPNSANGVVHIITESPLQMKERFKTTVSLGGGIRSKVKEVSEFVEGDPNNVEDDQSKLAYMVSLRHAANLTRDKESGLRVGYKVSGKYFLGHDWRYRDLYEPAKIARGYQSADGSYVYLTDGTPRLASEVKALLADSDPSNDLIVDSLNNVRPTENTIYNFEGRLDLGFGKNTELVFTGGMNSASGVEMTGLGAAYADNWRYTFGQIRFIHRNLFAQVYMNGSNSGNTYLMRDGNSITDKSKFYSGQVQHSSDLFNEKLKLIYGVDALLTRPNTKGTINGRNEDSDNIDEYGAYLQGDYGLSRKINLIAALRVDKHSFVDDPFLSPRGAIVYKMTPTQSLRLTYNRAFSSPSALNTSLDILSGNILGGVNFGGTILDGINVRGAGNRGGLQFSYGDNGLPQYTTYFSEVLGQPQSTYYNLGDNTINNFAYSLAVGGLAARLKALNLVTPETIDGIVANIIPGGISGVDNVLKVFTTNPQAPFIDSISVNSVKNLGAVRNSATQTIELGYKGIIKNKLAVTLDVYRTDISDFVTPLVVQTPNVFLKGSSVAASIQDEIVANLNDPANALYKIILTAALDTAQVVQGIPINGNSDGDPTAELVTLISAAASQVPIGTVSPQHNAGPDMLLTYSNFGDVTLYGAELGVNYMVNDNLRFGGQFAWVNDDTFETEGRSIALNAPKLKAGFTANYTLPKVGLDLGLKYRWMDSFPVNSGVYVGRVSAMNLVDLNIGYTPSFSKNTQVSLSIQNLLDTQIPMFVGAPKLGRFTVLQISHTFSVD